MPYYEYRICVVVGGKTDDEAAQKLDALLADDRVYAVEWIDGGTEYQDREAQRD